MNKKSRKPRDTSKKRKSILDAAIREFKKYGYYDCSMDQISLEANASKRTVYNHFPSKEVLFDAVISDYLKSQEEFSNITFDSSRSISEQLEIIVDAEVFLIKSKENRGLAKVLTTVFLRNPELAIRTKAKYCKTFEKNIKWFQDAKQSGLLNIDDPIKEAEYFISLVQGRITWPALFVPEPDEKEFESKKNELIERYLNSLN